MSYVLCTDDDLQEEALEKLPCVLTEAATEEILLAVRQFFRKFVDTRLWSEFPLLSTRAENVLKKYGARTVADVHELYILAQSRQGVSGAGTLVVKEWETLLHKAGR